MLKMAPWKNRRSIEKVSIRGRIVATREANVMASNQRGGGAQATVEALVWDGAEWWVASPPKFDFGREPLRTPHHVRWSATPPAEALWWATRIASRVDLEGDRESWTREAITQLIVSIDPRCAPPSPEARPKKLVQCPDCGSTISTISSQGFSAGFIHLPSCPRYRGNKYPNEYTTGECWE